MAIKAEAIQVWACGWLSTDGVECVRVFDTKSSAMAYMKTLDVGVYTKADVWEVTAAHDVVHQ